MGRGVVLLYSTHNNARTLYVRTAVCTEHTDRAQQTHRAEQQQGGRRLSTLLYTAVYVVRTGLVYSTQQCTAVCTAEK